MGVHGELLDTCPFQCSLRSMIEVFGLLTIYITEMIDRYSSTRLFGIPSEAYWRVDGTAKFTNSFTCSLDLIVLRFLELFHYPVLHTHQQVDNLQGVYLAEGILPQYLIRETM